MQQWYPYYWTNHAEAHEKKNYLDLLEAEKIKYLQQVINKGIAYYSYNSKAGIPIK
ncbi:hypothetical protein [Chryseobacterium sp. JUb7]|uniref:hypothetical protein n=1 Tax=Chryseobacterium sp. JUb7 TaxID=2940599 RepID=UPI002167F979|nr:hypothetical protein [Chryseobacterium sp. JUb7]MCS3530014.1 hypothetical protein [Chryseobacterium sp. JUb7]